MAIIRNAARRIMKGRVGEMTYYVSKGQQVARQAQNDSNYGETARRTESQQSRRILWANLVQFYKVSARWMPKAFETKGVGQTDYNKFMQVNIGNSRVALTKEESVAAACVVDEYVVTQGSLPSISVIETGPQWRTNLALGNLTIGDATTIGELTEALVGNNANVREGMQISFVYYMQSMDSLGTPRVNCRCYECTLVRNSTLLVRDYLPDFCSTTVNGTLGTSATLTEGGFAYILSELVNGQLRVSTQQLILNNAVMVSQYTSAEQIQSAMQSYGIDTEVILSPTDTIAQEPERVIAYITFISYMDGNIERHYSANTYFGPLSVLYNNPLTVYVYGLAGRTVSSIKLLHGNGLSFSGTISTQTNNSITATFGSISENESSVLSHVQLTLSDETVVLMPLRTEPYM